MFLFLSLVSLILLNMKRAKVSSVYENRGKKKTREEKDYISRKARIVRSSTYLDPLYFYTHAVMVESPRDEHEVAMMTAIAAAAAREDDDFIILESNIIESSQDQASYVNSFCSSTSSHAVEEKWDENDMMIDVEIIEDDDEFIFVEPMNIEKTEESAISNPQVDDEGEESIVEDGESGESGFKEAIEAEAKMIIDETMMEKWEGKGPGEVWWEEQLPLTCTYDEEWMWGSQMGSAVSPSGLNGDHLGSAYGVEKEDEDDDIWNFVTFKDITNTL